VHVTTSTESYTAVATQARQATEITDQANVVSQLPTVDLTQPVARYFEFVQKSVDLNRDLATRWAELVTSMSGAVRDQAEKISDIAKDQTEAVANVATDQAAKAEQLAREQAEQAEQAQKEQARLARQAERAEAKAAHEKAREPYEELTKAELSDQLAERGLPKSGNVEELIERLVSADSE